MADARLILLLLGTHVLGFGAIALLALMAIRSDATQARPAPGSGAGGDGGDGGLKRPSRTPSPKPAGGPPLPDAVPARVRLRDHDERLADHIPPHEHRPAHEPERRPVRERC